MAYDEIQDADLVALDASHLFQSSTTMIGSRRGTFLRGYMLDFIRLFAPHLKPDLVKQAFLRTDTKRVQELFMELQLPYR